MPALPRRQFLAGLWMMTASATLVASAQEPYSPAPAPSYSTGPGPQGVPPAPPPPRAFPPNATPLDVSPEMRPHGPAPYGVPPGATPPPLSPPSASPPVPYDGFFDAPPPPQPVRDFSWIYIDAPRPREIREHDLITIIVDEKSETTLNSRFNRTRTATLKAELKEFIRLGESGNLNTAASNQPTIDANLNGRLNTTGQAIDQEGMRYRIAATVVDVKPNGTIVIEARKTIQANSDIWSYSLTGILRAEDISRDNTALSENIANLKIVKSQSGKVFDSTKVSWGIKLYDWFWPF